MGGASALGFSKYQTKEGFIMKNSALVVIDLQYESKGCSVTTLQETVDGISIGR